MIIGTTAEVAEAATSTAYSMINLSFDCQSRGRRRRRRARATNCGNEVVAAAATQVIRSFSVSKLHPAFSLSLSLFSERCIVVFLPWRNVV